MVVVLAGPATTLMLSGASCSFKEDQHVVLPLASPRALAARTLVFTVLTLFASCWIFTWDWRMASLILLPTLATLVSASGLVCPGSTMDVHQRRNQHQPDFGQYSPSLEDTCPDIDQHRSPALAVCPQCVPRACPESALGVHRPPSAAEPHPGRCLTNLAYIRTHACRHMP